MTIFISLVAAIHVKSSHLQHAHAHCHHDADFLFFVHLLAQQVFPRQERQSDVDDR